MILTTIVSRINKKLAGELLTYAELTPFLDEVIDEINTNLNAAYPVFSDLDSNATEYIAFPDKYIRSVVVPGAAWRFYVSDEEGMATAQQYQMDYKEGLFLMMRDMLYNIPEEYQADVQQGTVEFQSDIDHGIRGIEVNGNSFII